MAALGCVGGEEICFLKLLQQLHVEGDERDVDGDGISGRHDHRHVWCLMVFDGWSVLVRMCGLTCPSATDFGDRKKVGVDPSCTTHQPPRPCIIDIHHHLSRLHDCRVSGAPPYPRGNALSRCVL